MNEKPLKDIIYGNFNIDACYVLGQERRGENAFFSTFDKPRKINGFLYLYGCDGTYEVRNGEKKFAKKGDVVFLPPFCEYDSRYFNSTNQFVDCILVNLLFSDENGNSFFLSDELEIFDSADDEFIRREFCKILNVYSRPQKNIAELKSLAYKILSYFASKNKETDIDASRFKCIAEGIKYLETDIKQEKSIEEIARMCNMSSAYFRRLFKEYSGISPIKFRIKKRLDIAKELLLNSTMSVVEISDYLEFENVRYFITLFKKYEKKSPLKYRNGERT